MLWKYRNLLRFRLCGAAFAAPVYVLRSLAYREFNSCFEREAEVSS